MAELRRPPGMSDVLPADIGRWRRVEGAARRVFRRYGYQEIRTPLLEQTSLFARSVGETSDIVEKEMYTFAPGWASKGGATAGQGHGHEDPAAPATAETEESLTLRPEITASVIRAVLENSLLKQKTFHKLCYLGPCFRRERPQKGRLRQFHQIGVEALGSAHPSVDAEVILLYLDILRELGVAPFGLKLNSLGCATCRAAYRETLRQAVVPDLASYCGTCRGRCERNVFRIFDCKSEVCRKLAAKLPAIVDALCEACRDHFAEVRSWLDAAGTACVVDPRLVRGLDYYTRTVFEVTSPRLGAQDALAGGGRYDGLVSDLGGPPTPAVGFASGVERLLLALDAMEPASVPGASHVDDESPDAYLVSVDDGLRRKVFGLARAIRDAKLSADLDLEGRSVKAQMRNAHRSGARFTVVLGPEEDAKGAVKVKVMATGQEEEVFQGELPARLRRMREAAERPAAGSSG